MPGEPFRIGDNEAIGGVAEGIPKRLDFRLRRTATSWRVGFV